MSLSRADVLEIKEAVREGIKESFDEHGLSLSLLADDHRIVQAIREGSKVVRRASIWTLVTTALIGLLGIIWGAWTGKIG